VTKKIGQYTVARGKIRDGAGVEVSPRAVAGDARRAANHARGNADTARGSHPIISKAAVVANRKLKQDAVDARDALREARRQGKKK
jgi:hypothetical protein